MKVTCPSCGADMDLDVLLAHEDSRRSLLRLVELSVPLAKLVVQYIRLFKPSTRAMSIGRVVKLIDELLPDLQRAAITHKGREWAAPHELWRDAIALMVERRDTGKLAVPLTSHGYLFEVICGMADKAEAAAERDAETVKKARAATVTSATNVSEVLASTRTGPPPGYDKPSPAALAMRAEIDAYRARRAGKTAAGDAIEGQQP